MNFQKTLFLLLAMVNLARPQPKGMTDYLSLKTPLAEYRGPETLESCPVPELEKVCLKQCENDLLECVIYCGNDSPCLSACMRLAQECEDSCPCRVGCPDGCTGCSNSVCFPNAVLVLASEYTTPVIIDFDGNFNDDLDFEFGPGTNARNGCGVTFMDRFWYFGGTENQVSKIVGCRLEKQADLPFTLYDGACNTFLYPTPIVLLCFDSAGLANGSDGRAQVCHTFDGQNYRLMESSKYVHYRTLGLANYKNQALTTGCEYGICDRKTEIFNLETMKWSEGPDYPFGSGPIYMYSTAQSSDTAYIIGGPYSENIIAEFKESQWRRLNDLSRPRERHGSITVGTKTMVVGGNFLGGSSQDFMETEVWELETGNNRIIGPTLNHNQYAWGIGLYAVDFNFCRK